MMPLTLNWSYLLEGPKGTPYEGGWYWGRLRFPKNYPFGLLRSSDDDEHDLHLDIFGIGTKLVLSQFSGIVKPIEPGEKLNPCHEGFRISRALEAIAELRLETCAEPMGSST